MTDITNKTYNEISIGDSASLSRTLTEQDIIAFAGVSGDTNPAHLDHEYAAKSIFHDVIGHGMWTGALISTLLGTKLPGPGTIYVSQTMSFRRPVYVGNVVTVTITAKEKIEKGHRVLFECEATDQDGETVLLGEAEVMAPKETMTIHAREVPRLLLAERGDRLEELIHKAAAMPTMKVGVVHPVDEVSLCGALEARDHNIIEPILIGPQAKIEETAASLGLSLSGLTIHDVEHSHAAGEKAAELASTGEVAALMKGALHTDEVLTPLLDRKYNLRTERRLSHTFVMDAPGYHKLLMITDAAVNISPNLHQKADILCNAIQLAHALGIEQPKTAILSAVETVNEAIPSTLDAAALCKMVDRGQIKGVIVDGPLAFDNAISPSAAATKGIVSPVAGDADILLVPDLVSGNMLAKQLDYLGGAASAGIVLGARIPVILTSRAEGPLARLASAAIARFVAEV